VVKPIQLRVGNFLRLFLEKHFSDMDDNTVKFLRIFLHGLEDPNDSVCKALRIAFVKQLKLVGKKENDPSLPAPPSKILVKKNPQVLLSIPSKEIAEQLCIIEFEYFSHIKVEEWIYIYNSKERKESMDKMIAHFNDISRWVQDTILREEKYRNRAKYIEKFIRVSEYLSEMNNFETMMAIISALQDAPIHRLAITKSCVGSKYLESQDQLHDLMKADGAYAKYRVRLREVIESKQPCIPYLGVYRRDLIHHWEVMTKETGAHGERVVDFKRHTVIHQTVSEIQQLQSISYNFSVDLNLSPVLRNLPQPPKGMDNDEYKAKVLFELSQKREPRGANRSDIT